MSRVYVAQREREVGTIIVLQAFSELHLQILSFLSTEFKEESQLFTTKKLLRVVLAGHRLHEVNTKSKLILIA